jgi:hypothetical protein
VTKPRSKTKKRVTTVTTTMSRKRIEIGWANRNVGGQIARCLEADSVHDIMRSLKDEPRKWKYTKDSYEDDYDENIKNGGIWLQLVNSIGDNAYNHLIIEIKDVDSHRQAFFAHQGIRKEFIAAVKKVMTFHERVSTPGLVEAIWASRKTSQL